MAKTRINRRELLAAAAIAVIATGLSALATHYLTFLASLEQVAADVRVAALQKPIEQSKEIVVVAITEETLAQFPYRSPVDRAFLVRLLETLDRRQPAVIGLDVLFDQPTEPPKDTRLAKTLRSLASPLLVSYTNTPGIVNKEQLDYLDAFVPQEFRAAANLATDPFDGSVRWIFPGETSPGMPIGFVRKAIQLVGRPLPPPTQVEIAWRPQPDVATPPFPIYPAHAVAALPPEWFKGKVVLIGATLSITDKHRTPMSVVHDDDRGMMPGILVQAHGISQYLENRTTQRLTPLGNLLVGLVIAAIGVAIGLLKKGIAFSVFSGAAVLAALWVVGLWGYGHGLSLIPLVAPSITLALSLWMMDMLIGRAERKQRQFVQGAFSRYVAPAVVEQLVENPSALSITGKRQEASFVFTDIAGFTTLSEQLASDQLSDVLNAYLDGACEIVQRHQGTVDKFIGDAIMAIFNAPLPQADHAERAVRCALDLDAYAEAFRRQQNDKGIPIGITRIGVHCGQATIGNFGSQSRMDFTALGDTVNTAARTEGVNKYFGTRICCTAPIVAQCPNMHFRPIGDVVLKGKTTPVTLFHPVTAQESREELFRSYVTAYEELKNESEQARGMFQALGERYPDDPLVNFHIARITSGLYSTVVVMEDK